jgi:hypothetical protein
MGDIFNINVGGNAQIGNVIGKIEAGSVSLGDGLPQLLSMLESDLRQARADGRIGSEPASQAQERLAEAKTALALPSGHRRSAALRALENFALMVGVVPGLVASTQKIIDLVQGVR